MQRVYVCPTARRHGIGESLVNALLDHAARVGFSRVRLDTSLSDRPSSCFNRTRCARSACWLRVQRV
jgi:GNAT superfamily N-acetyltransferase